MSIAQRVMRRHQAAADKPPTKSQLDYLDHLLKQQGQSRPDNYDRLTMTEVSMLIDGLKKKRGKAVWYGNGQFSHWERTAASQWKKVPGRAMDLAAIPGGSMYAQSADKRLAIWVSRWLSSAGKYVLTFSAVDYGIPSNGARFTEIPIPQTARSDPKKVMTAAEKWAEEHP